VPFVVEKGYPVKNGRTKKQKPEVFASGSFYYSIVMDYTVVRLW
jgi:hypothetical protein